MAKKRIPCRQKTIRRVVPISIIKITDIYKSKLKKRVKDKHKNSISDRVVLEIFLKAAQEIDDKKFFDKVPKKYLKKR